VREAARTYTSEAIKTLAKLLRSGPPAVRVRAAEALLNRAWGTPTQGVELSGPGGTPMSMEAMSHEERDARIWKLVLDLLRRRGASEDLLRGVSDLLESEHAAAPSPSDSQ
jgi:hypothetical protein